MRPKRVLPAVVCFVSRGSILEAFLIDGFPTAERQSRSLEQNIFKAAEDGDLEGVMKAFRRGAN